VDNPCRNKEIPSVKGYSAAGCNIPALHVGGDYYDIIKLTDDKYAIVIADVSGKGTPASLLMSNIQSAVHSFLKFYNKDFALEDATQKINELIFSNTSSEKFITLESSAIPLPIENVDTDQIIPARFLKAVERKGFGDNLFRDWRYDKADQPVTDFVLNNPRY